MGSLTITGPTGEMVGAKSDSRLGAVSGEAGPLGSGVGQMVCRDIGGEVNASELLSMISSRNEWLRSGESGAQLRGPGPSMRGPGQSEVGFFGGDREFRREVEVGTPVGEAPIRSLQFQRRDSEMESPENEAEK